MRRMRTKARAWHGEADGSGSLVAMEREARHAAGVGVRMYRSLREAEPGLAMATAMAAGWNRGVQDSCACCGGLGARSSIKSSLTEPT